MQSSSTTHPLFLLSELEEACKSQIPVTLPSTNNNYWVGIGFYLDKFQLAIQTKYINEVLDSKFLNNISKVPSAKSWFVGLVSVRGQPLPVIDLKDYLLGESTKASLTNRLIVIRHNNANTGLIVEEVVSLKQFRKEDINHSIDKSQAFSPALERFIRQVFGDEKQPCGQLSIEMLTNDAEFLNASIF